MFIGKTIRQKFACFDTLGQLMPKALIKTFIWIVVTLIISSFANFEAEMGVSALVSIMFITICNRIVSRLKQYFVNIFSAIYVFIVENKRIIEIPLHKKIWFCLTWPTFDVIYRYATILALFMKVTWKPIPHTSKVKIDDISHEVREGHSDGTENET